MPLARVAAMPPSVAVSAPGSTGKNRPVSRSCALRLAREMPGLEAFFHYRNLDVSTLKILAGLWAPVVLAGVSKSTTHLALADIHDSIAELRHYREHLIVNRPT